MIDVAHHRHHRSAHLHDPSAFSASSTSHVASSSKLSVLVVAPKSRASSLGEPHVQGLVDSGENLAVEQQLDDEARLNAQLLGQFLDRDSFADRNFFVDFRQRLRSWSAARAIGACLPLPASAARR